MIDCKFGSFELSFEETGKLFRLNLQGIGSVLHESDYNFDLKDGRVFHPGGWDECFPTIEPYSSWPVMGQLIGVDPELAQRGNTVEQVWNLRRFTAKRHFAGKTDHTLEVVFRVINHSEAPMEFLWASHALFSLEDLTRVILPDATIIEDFSLDGSATKTFVKADGPVRFFKKSGEFSLRTNQPWWGIWFNRGGWPANHPAGFGCLGIEATNAAADLPQDAWLKPGDSFAGCVWVEL
jgi:hypothetical protein